MAMISDQQAYAAMYYFLQKIYDRNSEYAFGALMGDMSLLPDGDPADIAVKHEWAEAIQFALNGGRAGALTFTEPNKQD